MIPLVVEMHNNALTTAPSDSPKKLSLIVAYKTACTCGYNLSPNWCE